MKGKLLLTLSLTLSFNCLLIDGSSYQTCPLVFANRHAFTIKQFAMQPQPLVLRHKRTIYTNLTIQVNRPIHNRFVVAVDIYKLFPSGFRVRLPCFNGLGSCRMTVLRARRRMPKEMRSFFTAMGLAFHNGSIPTGRYSVTNYEGIIWAPHNSPESRLLHFLGSVSLPRSPSTIARFLPLFLWFS
jgi:hypothetical protein